MACFYDIQVGNGPPSSHEIEAMYEADWTKVPIVTEASDLEDIYDADWIKLNEKEVNEKEVNEKEVNEKEVNEEVNEEVYGKATNK